MWPVNGVLPWRPYWKDFIRQSMKPMWNIHLVMKIIPPSPTFNIQLRCLFLWWTLFNIKTLSLSPHNLAHSPPPPPIISYVWFSHSVLLHFYVPSTHIFSNILSSSSFLLLSLTPPFLTSLPLSYFSRCHSLSLTYSFLSLTSFSSSLHRSTPQKAVWLGAHPQVSDQPAGAQSRPHWRLQVGRGHVRWHREQVRTPSPTLCCAGANLLPSGQPLTRSLHVSTRGWKRALKRHTHTK